MKKYIKDLFSKGRNTRGVGCRGAFLLVVLASILGVPFCARAYQNMGSDRILLMNDDSRPEAQGGIENQGYYCTNHTAGTTYWKHEPIGDNSSFSTRNLLHGTDHVFYRPDGRALWRLKDCRAGYVQTTGTAAKDRIWLPWSATAQKSGTSDYKATVAGKTVTSYTNEPNATVIMRNSLEAKVYSPFYRDGIGTLYFDAVNSYTAAHQGAIAIQISTNLTQEAQTIGDISFEEVDEKVDFSKWDDYYEWKTIPLTVLEVKNGRVLSELKLKGGEADTNLVMNVTDEGAVHYYRLRTQLNYYGPIRFRICRTGVDSGLNPDTAGLILIDNIVASYPPATVIFDRVGDDFDPSLTGTSVLGCIGDFDKPFLTYADTRVNARINFSWVTNFQDTTQNLRLSRPFLNYRWRYLDQKVNSWQTVPMTTNENETVQANVSFQKASSCTQLVTVAGIPLSDGVGDLEYFYTASFSGPYYTPRDYANDTAAGFGKQPGSTSTPWSEAITSVSNRLEIAGDAYTPARGRDYFTRIREGMSDYKWVALCTSLTTNGTEGAVKQDIRMELVGDHTWRTHYYVPTNRVGERLSFHFQGEEIFTNAWVAGYHHRTNTWYCDIAELPYIPYTSAAGLGYYRDISCVLDGVGTHLLIEFNDELLSFSISHATYQNFNAWTDATSGYVGHTNWNGEGAVGVSDTKKKWELMMTKDNGWEGSVFDNTLWYEAFDSDDRKTYPFNTRFDERRTPNGWTAGHGIFVPTERNQTDKSMSLQIEGGGLGWIAMDSFSAGEMPKGIDKVSFRARVAQELRFDDFVWYMDELGATDYAICTRLSMGHGGSNVLRNPADISPGTPSVSLVGYYRPFVGCYEFRITRYGPYQLCAALYKWVPGALGMECKELSSSIIAITDSGSTKGFGNYLVPARDTEETERSTGSHAYLLITKTGSSTVHLEGWLSKNRDKKTLAENKDNMVKVVSVDDEGKNVGKILTKGSFGVGSADCLATFYELSKHKILSDGKIDTTGIYIEDLDGYDAEDWGYFPNRWTHVAKASPIGTANFEAVMPSSQTIKLDFKLPTSGDGWQESGYEQVVNSFSTNKYEFLPRVSQSYQVRLRTGGNSWDEVRTDLVVDEIRVTSWQAENYPDLAYYYGQSEEWVYMQGVVTNYSGKTALSLQPSRAIPEKAQGLRSRFLANGLSMFCFDYVNATANTKLLLQICTNLTAVGSVSETLTTYPPENYNWTTVRTWDFSTDEIESTSKGTLAHFMSMRAPIKGLIRLVTDKSVIEHCTNDVGKATRDYTYGQITITGAYCYDEPALDERSWYAWNFYTAGWNTADKRFGYLFDSPDGLSGSLNFSARDDENKVDPSGIGLADRGDIEAYKANNSFVQCPPMSNGIGSVSFRARTFETNAAHKVAYVTLYGSYEPDDDQLVSPDSWKRIRDFPISNTTYQTFQWKTTDDSLQYRAIRLEMAGSHTGRNPSTGESTPEWDRPKATPLQRVFLDEISVGEPIQPRVVFRNVRPFRTGIMDVPPSVVSNNTDLSEQPLFGESWGLQCTIEPQQMGDELDQESIKVFAAFKRGISPWGYENWSNEVRAVQLDHIPGTLTFRSSYNFPESIISPADTPSAMDPENVWQYYIWCEFADKAGNKHRHGLDKVDWSVPSWYYGLVDYNEQNRSQGFAGYTILDTISPRRAWINEVNIYETGEFNNSDGEKQFIEIAIPRGANIDGWMLCLVDSRLNKNVLATFGRDNAAFSPNPKTGLQLGVDWTNNYTVVALRSPQAAQAGFVSDADAVWNSFDSGTASLLSLTSVGSMLYYERYGLQLVRPSGAIEHEIVVQGTNIFSGANWIYGSGTNLLDKLKTADGPNSTWMFAGVDDTTGTLGVFKSHGESEACWTNTLVATPSKLNMFEDGTRQLIDPAWFLQPNGTNVWIYATVLGDHIHQAIGSKTNNSEVFIIKKGTSTNIVYTADKWWALSNVTTNALKVAEAEGRADRADNHTWTLNLKDVQETVTVYADEKAGADVAGMDIDKADPYFPAIMDWLAKKDDSKGLYSAQFVPLHGNMAYAHPLSLKEMYWLDIDPTQEGWVLRAGMGGKGSSSSNPVQPVYFKDYERVYTNSRVVVTMMITNTISHDVRAPDHLLGLEPGSNSRDYSYDSPAWTSVTFKICGALQRTDVTNIASNYYPLRWFVFTKDSFDKNFQSKIDLWDPYSPNSPGWFYGWGDYPGVQIWYRWRLDGDPAWYDTAEPLRADSTYSE